ncbi:MAG: hypothetical protein GXC73_13020, partial [Chitinophagaceae bacterium]|nr:hypothetical protein [Chitinophagaceae bacterium]
MRNSRLLLPQYKLIADPLRYIGFTCLLFFSSNRSIAQDSTISPVNHFTKIEQLAANTTGKIEGLEKKLTKKTERYLHMIYKQERKLRKKILAIDSGAAQTLFSYDPGIQMNSILSKIKVKDSSGQMSALNGTYLPYLDSLQGVLRFPALAGEEYGQLKDALQQVNTIQKKLADADALERVILQRKEQIKRYLLNKTNLPRSLKRSYGEYAKQVASYRQELTGIKETLNDPDKLLRKALVVANKTAVFRQFMQRNSFLTQFLPVSVGTNTNGTGQMVTGLLSRNQFIQNVNNSTGSRTLESIVQQAANRNSGQSMPDFGQMIPAKDETVSLPEYAPNTERSKSFKDRLEYGTNLQTQRGTTYFPVTSDIAVSVGYKLNTKSIMGIGASYKLGLGENIQNIRLTNQGVGLRSFIDYKLKG